MAAREDDAPPLPPDLDGNENDYLRIELDGWDENDDDEYNPNPFNRRTSRACSSDSKRSDEKRELGLMKTDDELGERKIGVGVRSGFHFFLLDMANQTLKLGGGLRQVGGVLGADGPDAAERRAHTCHRTQIQFTDNNKMVPTNPYGHVNEELSAVSIETHRKRRRRYLSQFSSSPAVQSASSSYSLLPPAGFEPPDSVSGRPLLEPSTSSIQQLLRLKYQ